MLLLESRRRHGLNCIAPTCIQFIDALLYFGERWGREKMDNSYLFLAMIITSAAKVLLVLIIATLLIYFGYRLFYLAESKTGNLEIESKFGKVRLLRATPGIFLTFFGTVVLVVALFKGSTLKSPAMNLEGSFNSVAPISELSNQRVCATEVHWAINSIRTSSGYGQSAGRERTNFDTHLGDLETVLAQCVDAVVGPGAYKTYLPMQQKVDKGEPIDADKDRSRIYENVKNLLAD